jgi:hypothetical protein
MRPNKPGIVETAEAAMGGAGVIEPDTTDAQLSLLLY